MKFFKRGSPKNSGSVIFEPMDKSAEIGESENLLQVALSNKIAIAHTCEGMGSCTTCRVFVKSGEMSPRTEVEQERALERNFLPNERLSCQLVPVAGMVVEIPQAKSNV